MGKQLKQMRNQRQQSFIDSVFERPKDAFGGSLLKGNPKKARPLDSKLPIHLVLRADKGGMRLPKVFGKINRSIVDTCNKHGVKLYKAANVGNHLHLLIKIRNRRAWNAFIRELTGRVAQIAQSLAGTQKAAKKFWNYRPYTRIVRGWRRAFKIAKEYVELNLLESEGLIDRRQIKTLKEMRAIWSDG